MENNKLTFRELRIVALYKQGEFQSKICQKIHCKRETLLKALEKAGCKVLSKSERNRTVTVNPFNQKTDQSDYWLGYFIADGNISKKESKITITSKDLPHLEKFHRYCKNPNKINKKSGKDCYVSGFSNKEVKEWLISNGIPPNKSFTVNPITQLNWSIIRGLFDGDGCITTNKHGWTTVYVITGSPKLKEKLLSFLEFESIGYTVQTHTNCWKIVIRKYSHTDFGNRMYKNADVYLERKYERYRPFLEKSKNDNGVNSGEVYSEIDNPEPSYVE